jgi:hypothetical protein
VRSADGFAPGLSTPAGLPILPITVLAVAAISGVVPRDRPGYDPRDRCVELGVGLAGWDPSRKHRVVRWSSDTPSASVALATVYPRARSW